MNRKIAEVVATGIAHNGAAIAQYNSEKVYIHGMLVGEKAIISIERKHNVLFGKIVELTSSSPLRNEPKEKHYLSCSPWQIMHYDTQVEYKMQILTELFGRYIDKKEIHFIPTAHLFGYRTKTEYSLTDKTFQGETIPLSLAFRERNNGRTSIALEEGGCLLASETANAIAVHIARLLAEQGYTYRESKGIVIRESKSTGNCLAILYLKERRIPEVDWKNIPNLAGLHVYYSTHKSPALVATELLSTYGETSLTEDICGVTISYEWNSFFQNNIPLFENAVSTMGKYLTKNMHVLELYSGVGTIGLLLSKNVESVHGVEIHDHSVRTARKNAKSNNITNYTAETLPSENIPTDYLSRADALILDPPRSGIPPNLIQQIKETGPEIIEYLSCNPETQARDYAQLKDVYTILYVSGFDFYPGTPHLESLLVLKKRQ